MTIPSYTIAVDAIGGDFAPSEIVLGAVRALELFPDTIIQLTGPESLLQQTLSGYAYDLNRLKICHAPQMVTMADKPSDILRKSESSLVKAITQVAHGQTQGFISAGNSGAAFMAAVKYLGKIPGVSRPALAVPFPTQRGMSLLLDAGANVHCQPQHLLDFAALGSCYAQQVLGIAQPLVGLLNIGEEKSKGPPWLQEAFRLIEQSGLHFYGNIEGWDLPRGTTDVVVCDGLVGNIALKLTEGLGELMLGLLETEWPSAQTHIFRRYFDYTEYGGSLLLGIDGVSIITHGRANHVAICNAIGSARRAVQAGVIEHLKQQFSRLGR